MRPSDGILLRCVCFSWGRECLKLLEATADIYGVDILIFQRTRTFESIYLQSGFQERRIFGETFSKMACRYLNILISEYLEEEGRVEIKRVSCRILLFIMSFSPVHVCSPDMSQKLEKE